MAYPFFSLSKSPRIRPIDFVAGNVAIRVEAVPDPRGLEEDAALLTVVGLVACGKSPAEPSATAKPAATSAATKGSASATAPSNSAAPERVLATLARIAGERSPAVDESPDGGRE